jgi:hypothetical protein
MDGTLCRSAAGNGRQVLSGSRGGTHRVPLSGPGLGGLSPFGVVLFLSSLICELLTASAGAGEVKAELARASLASLGL